MALGSSGARRPTLGRDRLARAWFGACGVAVVVGLVLQTAETTSFEGGRFDSTPARVANLLAFFTIQSNLLVGVTSVLLAVRLTRTSEAFRAVRLAALLDIAVTGIVFRLVLADLHDLEGRAAVADFLLHGFVPVAAVAGWALFGPRRQITTRTVAAATLIPVAWLAGTLARGHLIDWYPYPFLDATALGYLRITVNVVLVTGLFLVLAVGALHLDGRLPWASEPPEPTA